jgi:SAM-dependent methyltransferase
MHSSDASPHGRGDAGAWEGHWTSFDAATRMNPAHRYRRALLFGALEADRAKPLKVLDLGCGQGDFLREARDRFPSAELAGLDFSETGLSLARKRVAGAKLFQADFASQHPLPNELAGFATHVVCSEVLEHLDRPELLLENLKPLLAAGGKLLVTVPGGPRSAFDVHIGHRRHFSPRELAALLAGAGFDAEIVRGSGFPFFNLYKLVVVLRGRRLVRDIDGGAGVSRASVAAMAVFDRLFRLNADGTGLGWQTFGVFRPR